MIGISPLNFSNSLVAGSKISPIYTTPVPPVRRIEPISRDTVTAPVDTTISSQPFEKTLNKYISKYETTQQLTYNSNTPYDKASQELDKSIVLGMNIDLQA